MVASELTASARAMRSTPVSGDESGSSLPKPLSPLQNRAAASRSPYIQEHAQDLVAWQLLDDEAVERARKENKLIFLHIGYKACHFCRLMSTETFSNHDSASVLNESFVPVIVDREERPDIEAIYINYTQAVHNVGGWPLNVFLTPNLEPVFGGTYWFGPAGRRHNSDNNEEILDSLTIFKKLRDIWTDQESRCRKEATEIVAQLKEFAAEGTLGTRSISAPSAIGPAGWGAPAPTHSSDTKAKSISVSEELDLDQLEQAYRNIVGTFDPVYGGFGLAPKFLVPPKMAFLLGLLTAPEAVQDVVGEDECKHATKITLYTLRQIRDGALHDHIGATGFSRCSVTADWSIPNFEKLVTDNAQLLSLYIDAWKASGGGEQDEFLDVVMELVEYFTTSPIALPEGGFASTEAADSYYRQGDKEKREGAYYVWTWREFESVLDDIDSHMSPVLAAYWNVKKDGNVGEELDPNDDFIDQNILCVKSTVEQLSNHFSTPAEKIREYIETGKAALRKKREQERVRPETDDKIVAGWNGLVISALCKAASALKTLKPEQSSKCRSTAERAAACIKEKLWDANEKVLYRIWSGARGNAAFADDYAYFIQGLLDLFELTENQQYLEFADVLQQTQISMFYDMDGAFFTTKANSPHVILRLKEGMDTSLPSTNAVSVSNLFRLASLLSDEDLAVKARQTINAFEVEVGQHPWLFPGMLDSVVTARLGSQKPSVKVTYKPARLTT
ncbi:uncharacterized protein FIESC28_06594 [Fusarium coffeatum]|uniref:Spermatogenesis-associated protein 20-like TRX domain-containing protein n=1 Tax=Fusarium coffeatum TaxID=231269 RepID=A0A366RK14_9HYPO|nr:uncharacterized protein FIESC28_06594 [Fusarium coffeatum]RBR17092.1 hypothetical protein FIESC28_06594 [Fusarium coffeatum]